MSLPNDDFARDEASNKLVERQCQAFEVQLWNILVHNRYQGEKEHTLYFNFFPGNIVSNNVSNALMTTSILTFKCEAPISAANRLARFWVSCEL